jgi:hypothetical protein
VYSISPAVTMQRVEEAFDAVPGSLALTVPIPARGPGGAGV